MAGVRSCHTYGRSLSEARSRIREALSLLVPHAATAKLIDDVQSVAEGAGARDRQVRSGARSRGVPATERRRARALDEGAAQARQAKGGARGARDLSERRAGSSRPVGRPGPPSWDLARVSRGARPQGGPGGRGSAVVGRPGERGRRGHEEGAGSGSPRHSGALVRDLAGISAPSLLDTLMEVLGARKDAWHRPRGFRPDRDSRPIDGVLCGRRRSARRADEEARPGRHRVAPREAEAAFEKRPPPRPRGGGRVVPRCYLSAAAPRIWATSDVRARRLAPRRRVVKPS